MVELAVGHGGLGLLERRALGQPEERAQRVGRHAERLPAAVGLAAHVHEAGRAGVGRGLAALGAGDEAGDELAAEAALADAGRAGDGDHHGRGVLDAAVVRAQGGDELGVAPDEGRHRAGVAAHAAADHHGDPAREHLELEAATREVGRVRVRQEPAGARLARERRGLVDDLARRPGAVDPHPARGHADPRSSRRQRQPELERPRPLVAVGALDAEVRHQRVVPERQRVGAVLTEAFQLPGPLVSLGDVERHQGGHEACPRAGVLDAGLGSTGQAGQIGVAEQLVDGRCDFARRRGALVGVRREHGVDELVEAEGDVEEQLREPRRRRGDEARQGGNGVGPDVRRAPGDQLEERGPQRVDVAARVGRGVAAGLLGRHVRGRAHHRAGAGQAHVARRGHPEVDQLGVGDVGVGAGVTFGSARTADSSRISAVGAVPSPRRGRSRPRSAACRPRRR